MGGICMNWLEWRGGGGECGGEVSLGYNELGGWGWILWDGGVGDAWAVLFLGWKRGVGRSLDWGLSGMWLVGGVCGLLGIWGG